MRCLNFFGDGGACPPFAFAVGTEVPVPPFAETKKRIEPYDQYRGFNPFFNTNSLRAMLTQNTYIDKRTIEGLTVGTYIITFS